MRVDPVDKPLLSTKLYKPPPSKIFVDRPRLVAILNEGLHPSCRLIFIAAPAGFGKTSLLSTWVNGTGLPVAWITLDEGDNDPFRFLAYLLSAVKAIEPIPGQDIQETLQSAQHPALTEMLSIIVNQLSSISRQFILVLDDYHLITAPEVHKSVTFLIEHCPPQMHLVIATRKDPPLPIPLLRARGQLVELRQSDLCFLFEEAENFLTRCVGTDLSRDDVASLVDRTEGWIAGLQMAAIALRTQLSIRGKEELPRLIASFSGGHEYIVDYFAAEVLDQQPEDCKAFLLQTSILDQLCGPLCEAVTGQTEGQQMLERFQHANLFIINQDSDRRWFRYHHLFKELLAKKLRQELPETIPVLHQRASEWFEQQGLVEEAIDHALSAEDFNRATILISQAVASSFWKRGESATILRWLEALPDEMLKSQPELCAYYALTLFLSGQFDKSEAVLLIAEKFLEDRHSPDGLITSHTTHPAEQLGMLMAVRAYIAYIHSDWPSIIKYAQRALDLLPKGNMMWRNSAAINLGDAYSGAGNLTAAQQAYAEALLASRSSNNLFLALLAGSKLANTYRNLGQLRNAEEICQQLIQLANTNGELNSGMIGRVYAIWGDILCEWNELERAEALVRKAVDLSLQEGNVFAIGLSYLYLIRILFATNNFNAIEEILHILERYIQESSMPEWIEKNVIAWKAWIWILQGRLGEAAQILQEDGITTDVVRGYRREGEYLTLVRLLIAQDYPAEAIELLERLYPEAEATHQLSLMIVYLCLEAIAFQAQGLKNEAITTLEKAITLAEPEGYLKVFLEEGQPIVRLIYEIATQGFAPHYTSMLLSAFQEQPSEPQEHTIRNSELVEPLSQREMEVIHLLADGLSNQEIAAQLYLSLRTVKFHTSNIYSKLGVKSRTEAVAQARSLGLLFP